MHQYVHKGRQLNVKGIILQRLLESNEDIFNCFKNIVYLLVIVNYIIRLIVKLICRGNVAQKDSPVILYF